MIVRLKGLTYLDTRPVNEQDRLCAQAWMEGGLEAERRLREKMADEKLAIQRESVRRLMRYVVKRNRLEAFKACFE